MRRRGGGVDLTVDAGLGVRHRRLETVDLRSDCVCRFRHSGARRIKSVLFGAVRAVDSAVHRSHRAVDLRGDVCNALLNAGNRGLSSGDGFIRSGQRGRCAADNGGLRAADRRLRVAHNVAGGLCRIAGAADCVSRIRHRALRGFEQGFLILQQVVLAGAEQRFERSLGSRGIGKALRDLRAVLLLEKVQAYLIQAERDPLVHAEIARFALNELNRRAGALDGLQLFQRSGQNAVNAGDDGIRRRPDNAAVHKLLLKAVDDSVQSIHIEVIRHTAERAGHTRADAPHVRPDAGQRAGCSAKHIGNICQHIIDVADIASRVCDHGTCLRQVGIHSGETAVYRTDRAVRKTLGGADAVLRSVGGVIRKSGSVRQSVRCRRFRGGDRIAQIVQLARGCGCRAADRTRRGLSRRVNAAVDQIKRIFRCIDSGTGSADRGVHGRIHLLHRSAQCTGHFADDGLRRFKHAVSCAHDRALNAVDRILRAVKRVVSVGKESVHRILYLLFIGLFQTLHRIDGILNIIDQIAGEAVHALRGARHGIRDVKHAAEADALHRQRRLECSIVVKRRDSNVAGCDDRTDGVVGQAERQRLSDDRHILHAYLAVDGDVIRLQHENRHTARVKLAHGQVVVRRDQDGGELHTVRIQKRKLIDGVCRLDRRRGGIDLVTVYIIIIYGKAFADRICILLIVALAGCDRFARVVICGRGKMTRDADDRFVRDVIDNVIHITHGQHNAATLEGIYTLLRGVGIAGRLAEAARQAERILTAAAVKRRDARAAHVIRNGVAAVAAIYGARSGQRDRIVASAGVDVHNVFPTGFHNDRIVAASAAHRDGIGAIARVNRQRTAVDLRDDRIVAATRVDRQRTAVGCDAEHIVIVASGYRQFRNGVIDHNGLLIERDRDFRRQKRTVWIHCRGKHTRGCQDIGTPLCVADINRSGEFKILQNHLDPVDHPVAAHLRAFSRCQLHRQLFKLLVRQRIRCIADCEGLLDLHALRIGLCTEIIHIDDDFIVRARPVLDLQQRLIDCILYRGGSLPSRGCVSKYCRTGRLVARNTRAAEQRAAQRRLCRIQNALRGRIERACDRFIHRIHALIRGRVTGQSILVKGFSAALACILPDSRHVSRCFFTGRHAAGLVGALYRSRCIVRRFLIPRRKGG